MSEIPSSTFPDTDGQDMVEGFARVVAVEGVRVWAEPEEMTSCGTCHSAGLCSIGKEGGTARRKLAKRFALPGDLDLKVGERVVVGIREGTLVKGAFTAYGLPLAFLLGGGILGQERFGTDGMAALGAGLGLGLGILAARVVADILSRRGTLTPRYLRRAWDQPGVDLCHTEHG